MPTDPNQPATGGTLGTILTILSQSNGYISLGVQIAGVVIPLGKALIQKIEQIGQGNVTITFSDLVTVDNAELQAIAQRSADDLAAINAELARLGLPPISVPPDPTQS